MRACAESTEPQAGNPGLDFQAWKFPGWLPAIPGSGSDPIILGWLALGCPPGGNPNQHTKGKREPEEVAMNQILIVESSPR